MNPEPPRNDREEHPAVTAWRRARAGAFDVERVEVLKSKGKSAAYRLIGADPRRPAIIAKRSAAANARLERHVYQEILARLPLLVLRCHGFLEEPGDATCWLFLEDAGGRDYSPGDYDHRLLAGRWLGAVHAASFDPGVAGHLPDRGPGHYLARLRSSRTMLREHLANPDLPAEARTLFGMIVDRLDGLERAWGEVEAFCDTVPRTLVHGDLVVKNVRVRGALAGPALLVFDWGNAGWGVPGADLCQLGGRTLSPDLEAYGRFLQGTTRPIDPPRARSLAAFGGIFRLLEVIDWLLADLVLDWYDWPSWRAATLKECESWLAGALQAAACAPSRGLAGTLP